MPNNRPTLTPLSARPRAVLAPGGPGSVLADAWHIPLTAIDLNPHQARQHFDEAALAELTTSVRDHGVLEPILVRPVGDGERYEILAGERRYRAAQAAGLDTIPALVRHGLDDGQARVITALENLQREDLLPGDEARQYAGLVNALDISRRELARRLGINHQRIAKLLTILDKGPQLLDEIDTGNLTVNAALGQLDTGYYRPTNVSRIGTELQVGSSLEPPTPTPPVALTSEAGTRLLDPEDFIPGTAAPRTPRVALDDATAGATLRAFRPVQAFYRYAQALQPAQVPAASRPALRQQLHDAITAAQVALRALDAVPDEE